MQQELVQRQKRPLDQQFLILIKFIEANPELKSGNLTKSFVRRNMWEYISKELNKVELGPKKTPLQWRKVWKDKISHVKGKALESIQTGTSPSKNFTKIESMILNLIQDEFRNEDIQGIDVIKTEPVSPTSVDEGEAKAFDDSDQLQDDNSKLNENSTSNSARKEESLDVDNQTPNVSSAAIEGSTSNSTNKDGPLYISDNQLKIVYVTVAESSTSDSSKKKGPLDTDNQAQNVSVTVGESSTSDSSKGSSDSENQVQNGNFEVVENATSESARKEESMDVDNQSQKANFAVIDSSTSILEKKEGPLDTENQLQNVNVTIGESSTSDSSKRIKLDVNSQLQNVIFIVNNSTTSNSENKGGLLLVNNQLQNVITLQTNQDPPIASPPVPKVKKRATSKYEMKMRLLDWGYHSQNVTTNESSMSNSAMEKKHGDISPTRTLGNIFEKKLGDISPSRTLGNIVEKKRPYLVRLAIAAEKQQRAMEKQLSALEILAEESVKQTEILQNLFDLYNDT